MRPKFGTLSCQCVTQVLKTKYIEKKYQLSLLDVRLDMSAELYALGIIQMSTTLTPSVTAGPPRGLN